jgi:GntR family transcriptional regulator, transcriptional repressor for pyruvate dehydrogenase complex
MDSKVFLPVSRGSSLSAEVLRHFIDVLASGVLAPGDKLPPERELAQMMGISRPSLRDALRALSLLGVVVPTQGRGTYLADSLDKLPLEPYVLQLLLNRGKLREFLELRRIVEPEVAALAAERSTEAARLDITAKFEAYERAATSGDVDAEIEAGREFHEALARASGNHVLIQLMEGLRGLMSQTGRIVVSHAPGSSRAYHRDLHEAVTTGHASTARRIMKEHLAEVEKELRSSWREFEAERGDNPE